MRMENRNSILIIRTRLFLGHIMRKKGLDNLKLIGYANENTKTVKEPVNYITRLSEWIAKQKQSLLVKAQRLMFWFCTKVRY